MQTLEAPPGQVTPPRQAPGLRALNTFEVLPVAWLMPGRIPYGHVTVIAGSPGEGKSSSNVALLLYAAPAGEPALGPVFGEHGAKKFFRLLGLPARQGQRGDPAGRRPVAVHVQSVPRHETAELSVRKPKGLASRGLFFLCPRYGLPGGRCQPRRPIVSSMRRLKKLLWWLKKSPGRGRCPAPRLSS